MKKHILRFACGGLAYFLIEVVWRVLMKHGEPSFLMAPMGGIVCVVIMLLEDKKWNVFLSSLMGAVVTTLLELTVGSIALFCFNHRFWCYGRITWKGIISLDWFFKWWGICFAVILARKLLYYCIKKRKKKVASEDGKAV